MIAKIPIGIVGLNYGKWIVQTLRNSNEAGRYFQLAAVSDLDTDKAGVLAGAAGVPSVMLEQILEDPNIPAVGLFTGPVGRADLIRKIIRAGKHVMTTKPFELDLEKTLVVFDEARGLGRVVHLNSPAPLLPPDLAIIQRWREHFQLGRPIGCRSESYGSYDERADGTWYDDPACCPLAPVFRLGIYLIHDLVQIFGEADSVQVMHSRIRTGRPTPDNAQVGILFKNGALANVFASLCVNDGQPWANSMTLNFENGTIYRNVGPLVFGGNASGNLKLHLTAFRDGKQIVESSDYSNGSGEYHWEAFYRAISGESFETPTEVVASGIRVVAAMARAERSGLTEKV